MATEKDNARAAIEAQWIESMLAEAKPGEDKEVLRKELESIVAKFAHLDGEIQVLPVFSDRKRQNAKSTLKPRKPKSTPETRLNTAVEVALENAVDAGSIGFLGRAFVLATLPHKKVDGTVFTRRNGDYRLSIVSDEEVGLPYGVIPRLLLIWISEEVVRTKRRELTLGDSLSAFMADLGMIPTGGRWGTITRLKQQMKALFEASITASWEGKNSWGMKRVSIADEAILFWDEKNPGQKSIWKSKLVITERLFEELLNHSVPFDKRILQHLTKSPLGLDIYIWLTYRFHGLKDVQPISWKAVMNQLGSGYDHTPKGMANFKTEFKKQLQKVLSLYQTARVEVTRDDVVLYPSPTVIDPKLVKVIHGNE